MAVEYGSLPFAEAIQFFRGKDLIPTERWTDIWKEGHDTGFMVAGAMKADLLADLKAAVDKAIAQGTTLEEFRRDFDRIVKARGWTGWTGEGSEAGVAWRTKVIYETNLRTAYQAGRWAQVQALKRVNPYLIYRHSDLSVHPRPPHKSWDGLVVEVDSEWVKTHWPPNGWGCKCRMFSIGPRDLAKLGKTGPDTPPDDGTFTWVDKTTGEAHTIPKGIDPGWDYAPGASRVDGLKGQVAAKAKTLPPEIGQKLEQAVAAIPRTAPPVSLALQLPKSGAVARVVRETVAAIDAIHGDGALPTIPVTGGAAKGYSGAFRVWPDGRAVDIRITRNGPWPALTTAHEIGHFIDHQAIGTVGKFSYTEAIWADFVKAAGDSEAIQALRALPRERLRDYYLRPWEIWARAYAQWIAQKSGRAEMLAALDTIRTGTHPAQRLSQWSEADFAPIAAAIEAMFTQLGWL
jgi:hypothetical protein